LSLPGLDQWPTSCFAEADVLLGRDSALEHDISKAAAKIAVLFTKRMKPLYAV
jgi:hypothetical protein